ncbi:MAG: pyridoxal phosphate-dependent aminotransferase [Fidelibacterota bacterium]
MFADRVAKIRPSFTLQMASKAAELLEAGRDVINFSVGEPDFNTPENIRRTAHDAIENGYTKYTAGQGMMELRQAICSKFARENNLTYTPDQVLVSNGEKQSLSLACQALFQDGDEVIIFTPYWVSFPEFVRLADATPVLVRTNADRQFEPDWDDLERNISPRTKGVIINSPSNPTGGVWSNEAVHRLLTIAADQNWTVIADECYERLVYDGVFTSAEALNDVGATIITCMSLSKSYAMTGWRIGYAAGATSIIKAMSKIQGQATSCANAIGQKAAVEALTGDQSAVETMRQTFQSRRDIMISLLRAIPDVKCVVPHGAFYAFPDLSAYMNKKNGTRIIKDSFALSDYLLEMATVVTVPGDGFGAPGHIRFSFATGAEQIRRGIERVQNALRKLE